MMKIVMMAINVQKFIFIKKRWNHTEFTFKLRKIFVTLLPIPNEVPWAEMGLTFSELLEYTEFFCSISINTKSSLPELQYPTLE